MGRAFSSAHLCSDHEKSVGPQLGYCEGVCSLHCSQCLYVAIVRTPVSVSASMSAVMRHIPPQSPHSVMHVLPGDSSI